MIKELKQDDIHEICQKFTGFLEKSAYAVSLKYIFHHWGQRDEAIELENYFFQSHPAGSIALNILHKSKNTNHSQFHGLAIETTQSMMGLREQKHTLGIITINLDNHSTADSILREVYHLGWMAIDTARLLQSPKYKNNLKSGPLLPKRSALNLTKATLQADIFSVLVLADLGFDLSIKTLARDRCLDTMIAKTKNKPWHYPYPLAYQTTQQAWNTLIKKDKEKSTYHFILTPLQFASSIARTIPDEAYQQWWDFCKPAQEMAWQNHNPEYILSAAIHTSEDPIIQVTSLIIKNCTDLETSEKRIKHTRFNAFRSDEQNKSYHEKAIEETFEFVLEKGLEEQSAQPFIDEANHQNQDLTEGKVFGWCASALQLAANTFEKAEIDDIESTKNLITLSFKGSQQELKYESLVALGERIIEERKNGVTITLSDVEKMARTQKVPRSVEESVKETIKDPYYQNSLQSLQDLSYAYVFDRTISTKNSPLKLTSNSAIEENKVEKENA